MKNLFKIVLSYLLISFNTYVLAVENKNNALLKVGVLAPFSGEFKDLGESFLKAIQFQFTNLYLIIIQRIWMKTLHQELSLKKK